MTGPGFWNTDFAVSKVFPLRETTTLEFRTELFNLFNHPNFANPGSDYASPQSLGVISSTVSSPRILQLGTSNSFLKGAAKKAGCVRAIGATKRYQIQPFNGRYRLVTLASDGLGHQYMLV